MNVSPVAGVAWKRSRPHRGRGWALAWLPVVVLLWAACGKPKEAVGEREFTVRGVVRDIPADGRSVVVRHEEIPGYMPKMTMDLTLADTNEVRGLSIGDTIEFRLVTRAEDHFIDRIRRLAGDPARTNAVGRSMSGPASAPVEGLPRIAELKPGDPVPEILLVSEEGRELRISELRGRAVAMTFFFSRCPIPDFCPRMNRNFLEARERLRRDVSAPRNWMFLSVSFDPEFDGPVVLKGYAKAYRGANPEGWVFASTGPGALEVLKSGFDLKLARDGGGFSHNLRTVVIDREGRVFRMFDGNRWTPAELAEAMSAAAKVGEVDGAVGEVR